MSAPVASKYAKLTDERLLSTHAIGVEGLKVWDKRSKAYQQCEIEVAEMAAEIARRGLKPEAT